jgi:predicted O-linked N-acetylglucosamine transferase (SPINDLY family)
VRRRFLNLFSACGVTADRLDLRPWTDSFVGHLASFGDCDIVLDSFPYNGVTTTCEALAMGVPVIALAGDRIAGRYGATLLSAIGLEENIAGNEVDYVERALMQARDCARLARLRKELPARLWASPLANPRALAEALEDVYRQAWRRWVHADRR